MGDDQRYIIPSPAEATFEPVEEVPVELARTRRVQGRLFEKHILNKGTLLHPKTGAKITIDDAFVSAMQQNFAQGYCDIVQVPLANDKNEHVENPGANIGEVVGIQSRGSKVYALIDARDEDAAGKLGKTYLGASAFLSTNYTDSATNAKVGPTLLHVAVTNRPYVTGLDDYKEVLAATADNTGEVVVLSPAPEEPAMTREELIAALKADHGIDVEALQASAAAVPPDNSGVAASVVEALKQAGVVQLAAGTEGQVSQQDVVNAVLELAAANKTQADDIASLKRKEAEHEVDGYVSAGRVLPKQRAAFIELALTNRDMLDTLLPAEPVVKLNAQSGVTKPDGEQRQEEDIDAEVARLTAEHKQFFSPNGTSK